MDQYTINIRQAAALLGVSPPTLRRMTHMAGFPATKIGGRILIHREGLARWIEARTEGGVRE